MTVLTHAVGYPQRASNGLRFRRIVLLCAVDGFLALAFITGSEAYRMVALAVMLVSVFSNDVIGDFYLYVTLLPFSSFVTIQSRSILFVFLLISSAKLVYKHISHHISLLWFMSFLLIGGIEMIFDFTHCTIGSFAWLISIIIYVFLAVQFLPAEKIDLFFLTKVLIYTCAFAILVVIVVTMRSGMQLSAFTKMTDTGMRLGEQARDIGGAMGVPIYCLTIISCCFLLMAKYKTNVVQKMIYWILIGGSVFVGLLTVSRVFLLGLATFAFLLLISALREKNKKKLVFVLVISSLLLLVFLENNITFIARTLDLFRVRGVQDISTGRFSIWKSCIQHLTSNPLTFLLGNGAMYYVQIGVDTGKAFSMSAHNLYLDGVMSWGVCGFGLFVSTALWFQKCVKRKLHSTFSLICWLPLLVWLTMQMTGGSFNSFKAYIFPLALILVANQNTGEETS